MASKLKLFNTLTLKKQEFKPIDSSEIGMYACGPTVYHFAHIGNLRSYIFEDVLRRTLMFNGYKVKHVMNITDVGHLTSDADEGEDKMLKGAKREGKTVWEVAKFYTDAFLSDSRKLNILLPTVISKATEHIEEQIEMIKKLEKNGFTYFAGGNVYFDTSKLDDYGKLARLDLSKETRSRVGRDKNKKSESDFVLWFTKSKFQDQEMKWESPWGVGYPGWHIECSAMASKYLGEQFDIHCGGIDHIPVHHTNEIAQSESAFGKKPWVNYWLHNEFIVLAHNKKMSKSSGNFLTLGSLEKEGFDAMDFRYFCMQANYRSHLMFSKEALDGARVSRKKLYEKVIDLSKGLHSDGVSENYDLIEDYKEKFLKFINDDMNTPRCLALMWDMLKDDVLSKHEKHRLLLYFDQIFGFNLGSVKKVEVPKEIELLAKKRLEARKARDWAKSDEIRDKIRSLGWEIGDTREGYEIKKI